MHVPVAPNKHFSITHRHTESTAFMRSQCSILFSVLPFPSLGLWIALYIVSACMYIMCILSVFVSCAHFMPTNVIVILYSCCQVCISSLCILIHFMLHAIICLFHVICVIHNWTITLWVTAICLTLYPISTVRLLYHWNRIAQHSKPHPSNNQCSRGFNRSSTWLFYHLQFCFLWKRIGVMVCQ